MRIAFASCVFTPEFDDQPVWDWIGRHKPDRLLLLGDSLYLDVRAAQQPQEMSDDGFARHLFDLYSELMAQPQFAALVHAMPQGTIDAIWDDHDFLWNDALGAQAHPLHSGKVRLSTAFLEAFRVALSRGFVAGSFPGAYNDPKFWDLHQPALSTPSIDISPDVWLHLTDGRTHRTRTWLLPQARRTLFGGQQKDRFAAAVQQAPEAVHLWASGSTIAGYRHYANDLAWLAGLAAHQRILVLSGDVHRNDLGTFPTTGLPLQEATSSGAAVRDAVVFGESLRNYGLLDIESQKVTIQLFKQGRLERQRVLDRQSWCEI